MDKDLISDERLFIAGGALAGAVALTALTLLFWKVFDVDPNAHPDPGTISFTLPKGALLGGATAYIIKLLRAKQDEMAAKVALGVGGIVMLVFASRLDDFRTSLQWDGFTALWGLVILGLGAVVFVKVRLAKAGEEQEK